ncbi:hypothetical protein T484DRAFT_1803162 [Baffinella frigidus]|nr:hypothetical protein T484DRAFT_1803162 [Cryptophyta sp. CCMP2293]
MLDNEQVIRWEKSAYGNPCVEFDEFPMTDVATCETSAICVNTPGSFMCACALGYENSPGSDTWSAQNGG